MQTFFLAPQEKGYFVLNDIFHFIDEEIIYQQHPPPISSENVYQQHPAPVSSEDAHDTQPNSSSPVPEPPGNMLLTSQGIVDFPLEVNWLCLKALCNLNNYVWNLLWTSLLAYVFSMLD